MFYRFLFGLLCVAFIPLSYAIVVEENTKSPSSNTIQQRIKTFSQQAKTELKKHNIPGAAFVVIKNNKIIALETFGYTDRKKTNKINKDTVFRLASVSKPFAATITTMLAQENIINLSDPVTKHLPNFDLAEEGAANKIQLQHILSHTSGLMPNTYDNLLHETWSMKKIIGRFKRLSPICKPGICYGYQNIAYGFLQPVIEQTQAKSYSTLLNERIFTPLKMDNASVGYKAFKNTKNKAKPHVLIKSKITKKKDKRGRFIKENVWYPVKIQPDYYKVAPAAGINASISDLALWVSANMGNSPSVLSPNLLKELTTPRIRTKKDLKRRLWRKNLTDAHYGYGWRIYQFDNTPLVYHSGWVKGFRADIGYSPKHKVGFAMLMNAESNLINKLSYDFWKTVHKNAS